MSFIDSRKEKIIRRYWLMSVATVLTLSAVVMAVIRRTSGGTGLGSDATTLLLLSVAGAFFKQAWPTSKRSVILEKQLKEAENQVQAQPEKAKPAWDLARTNLELYFERNRSQVSQVFRIAVVSMAFGFGFVLFGVYLALQNKGITPTLVAGISGIITQFIGATFMVIYRSTMAQANEFMSVLERINTVGMAVQVLDSIPESELQLKNQTRAEIVGLLLNANIHSKETVKSKQTKAVSA